MNLLDFFDPKKKITPINVFRNARRELMVLDHSDRTLSVSSLATIATGTDYAEEYIKQSDKELFEVSKFLRGNESNLEDVSLATGTANGEPDAEEHEKIYKNYNLAYEPPTNLTIRTVQEQIVASVMAEPVTIIHGPTGCGKTTQVPQMIMDHCFRRKLPCNIVVTQPRRIAAISIARRVCAEREWPVGSVVGYKVGLSSCVSADTRLTYCTTGVLLQKLILAKNLNEFTHIVIDEIHERDQEMDFLLLVIRKLLRLNSRSVKIILMSATFQVDKFSKYFASYVGQNLVPARVIDVTKRNYYYVREFYLCELRSLGELPKVLLNKPSLTGEMIDFACRLMTVMDKIDNQSDKNEQNKLNRPTILVFLPGIHEIEEVYTVLTSSKNESSKWDIVVLHSSITNEEQQRIFLSPPKEYRRIILSTNIAESSITVPDVKYVIDFCLTKILKTDPATNFRSLELTWASKANCQQRSGRTGRVMDGRVYRMIPKEFYSYLPNENPPEIQNAPLENVILRTKLLDMGSPKALLALALDPPDLSNVGRTILLLKESGGLLHIEDDPFDGEITDLGQVMAALPMDIHIAKMIVLGHVFSVLRESIIIGASMSVKNMFSTPFQKKLEAYNAKLMWADKSSSDGIAFLNAYNVWQREKASARIKTDASEKQWAQRNCLQIRVLREVDALVQETTHRLERLGIKETVGANKVTYEISEKNFILKVVFAGAFYPYYFVTQPCADENLKMKMIGGMDPLKTIYLQGWPEQQPGMLYSERFQESFMPCCLNSNTLKINVKFDHSSRVYINFAKNEIDDDRESVEISGEIPLILYRALKMRQIGKRIVIPVLDVTSAIERAKELNIDTKLSTFLFRDVTQSSIKPSKEKAGIRPELPGLKVSQIRVKICRMKHPGRFWVRIRDKIRHNYAKDIENYIGSLKDLDIRKFDSTPEIGTLLLAPTAANKKTEFHRAIVQAISMVNKNNVFAHVFFIDFGVTSKIQICDLRHLPKDNPISNIPSLAFECILTNIKPAVMNTLSGEWSDEALDLFYKLTKVNSLEIQGQIYSVVNSVVSITLIAVMKSGEEVNVNQSLIDEKFAEFREEDYLSKYNNELRKNVDKFSEEEIEYLEEMQYNQNYINREYPKAPKPEECKGSVTLKGPYSPLEVEVVSLTTAGVGKKVRIHETSVNSILLDHTLVNPPERLLVAASVSQGAVSTNLNLMNTTLMPSIPGLGSLLALIFSPQIELRRNKFGTRYTGALCGLGYNKITKQSLLPEHDTIINFDVEITIHDLSDINRLRHYMSTGIFISKIDETTDASAINEDTIICQERIKDTFFKIIDKYREKIPLESDLQRHQWCKYDQDMFLKPGSISEVKKNIFKLHWALDLKQKDEYKESMIEHLTELKNIAGRSYKDETGEIIYCKLCKKDIPGIIPLRSHINSKYHRAEENRILHN